MSISFSVPIAPVPQPRQRMTVRGKFPVSYTPSKHPVNEFKATIRQVAAEYIPRPASGAVRLEVTFIFPRPRLKIWKRKPMPRMRHTGARDIDNLLKSVMDALPGIAYHKDGQVSSILAEKYIAAGDEAAHIEITVFDLEKLNEPNDQETDD